MVMKRPVGRPKTIVEEFPKLVSIKCHPDFSKHIWVITLVGGEYTVAFGNLREWLKKYAI